MMLAEFDARVAAAPDAVAVVDDRSHRTYHELDMESRAYSRLLRRRHVARETVVAIVAEREPQYVAMVLGVLRSGAAFTPIEATTPVSHARIMCAKARVVAIFVQPGHEAQAVSLVEPSGGDRVPAIVEAIPPRAGVEIADPPPERTNSGLAYVIFTSGSTGIPKGAMVTDGGFNNHLAGKTSYLGLGPADVVGFTAPLSFDISVWQALNALCVGGRVCVADAVNISEPSQLVAWVERHGVTILELVPSFLTVVLDVLPEEELRSRFRSLRFMIATGEALPVHLAARWYRCCPHIPLANAYGPTECADDVTHHIVTEAECRTRNRPSIGKEIANADVYVADDRGRETADAIEGELLIGGRCVGRGYIGDPVRTALTFVPDHLSGRPGERLYRSGDRAIRASDGTLHYLGRRDRQVKVRGQRVELGDVEFALRDVPGVASAACILTEDRVRAFVTLRAESGHLDGRAILHAVRESAPSCLVPQEVTVLDRLPTGTSGKVDYRALEQRRALAVDDDPTADDHRSARMSAIRAAFVEILDVSTVGEDDNFFAAGGDSLQAMRLMALVRARFNNAGATLRGFLSDPTPCGLLALLEAATSPAASAFAPPVLVEPGALSSGQERLWLLEQLNPRRGAQLLRLVLTLQGPLDVRALQHALDAVVIRHEPLRTVFSQDVGVPVATVWPRARIELQRVSVATGDVRRDLLSDSGLSARTVEPPLAAAQLVEIAPDHHVLTLVLHHLVADGWSLAVLGQDISTYYQRWIDGEAAIAAPPENYSDYVREEREWLSGSDAADFERYWREQLAGAALSVDLPLDRPRPDSPDFTANNVVRHLSVAETRAVADLSKAMNATPFMTVMAAVYITLRELTGTGDLVVGLDAVNRSWTASDQLVGTFVNQLPVRLSCPAAAPTFRDVLALARAQCLGAYAHERLPFHKIVAAVNPPRRTGRFPLFEVKVTQQGAWRSSLHLPGIEVTAAEIAEPVTHLDLILDVSGEFDRLRLELLYRPDLIDRETADAWVDALANVLRAGVSGPDSRAQVVLCEPRRSPDHTRGHAAESAASDVRIEPRTPTEVLVATVWRDVVELDEVFITDNFFAVGGHSLAAAQVVRELGVRTGVELDLETFFDLDTLEQVAAEIDRRRSVSETPDPSRVYEGEL